MIYVKTFKYFCEFVLAYCSFDNIEDSLARMNRIITTAQSLSLVILLLALVADGLDLVDKQESQYCKSYFIAIPEFDVSEITLKNSVIQIFIDSQEFFVVCITI